MLEMLFGAGFLAWLTIASAVMAGALGARFVARLAQETWDLLEAGWDRLWR